MKILKVVLLVIEGYSYPLTYITFVDASNELIDTLYEEIGGSKLNMLSNGKGYIKTISKKWFSVSSTYTEPYIIDRSFINGLSEVDEIYKLTDDVSVEVTSKLTFKGERENMEEMDIIFS